MAYTKPQIVAQNSAAGSYAAGCPARDRISDQWDSDGPTGCINCERTQ